jgi:hypothetical protein
MTIDHTAEDSSLSASLNISVSLLMDDGYWKKLGPKHMQVGEALLPPFDTHKAVDQQPPNPQAIWLHISNSVIDLTTVSGSSIDVIPVRRWLCAGVLESLFSFSTSSTTCETETRNLAPEVTFRLCFNLYALKAERKQARRG